ncbi:hypothetical protein [Lactococcus allomyrinae]|uniref:Uncharacterized protein n=1 Tax=Lactococcus allomyrinae TaxID=2419773 RepID=A0A387B853_9LACT|nr:hypothetical protein [Lactococcus allomyrinae]AYF99872.1 hypothetical protein D7I46_01495 [Lactococcus allomyrinae]
MFDNLGGNTDLLQYEHGKENIKKLLPPKIAHEYSQKENQFYQFLEQAHLNLSSEIKVIHSDFSSGASGKSADKIKEMLEEVGDTSFYSSTSFGF